MKLEGVMTSTLKARLFKRSQVFTLLALIGLLGMLGTLATLIWIRILPEQYFYDGELIRSLLKAELNPATAFDTFINTAWVFAVLGFNADTDPEITAISSFILAFVPIAACVFAGMRRIQLGSSLLFSAWIAVGSIYLGQLSKEIIALWFVALILCVIGLKRPIAWLAFTIPLVYAIGFRPYWLLIAAFWFLFWWLSYRCWNFSLKAIFLYGSMFTTSAAYYSYRNEHITEIRNRVNELRIGSDVAQSIIVNYLPNSSILHDVVNWNISWFFILFPIPVLQFLEPLQILFFLLTVSTTIFVYLFVVNFRIELTMSTPSQRRRIRACVTFLMAFTLVQAIFEPDYGSVLKHMTNLLPMLGYMLFIGRWSIKNAS